MTYQQALQLLQKKQSLGIQPGLTRILSLLQLMGNPQNQLKIIHIAGTNGKGTVAATLAQAIQNAGYRVGLFTSPWVIDYREQIQLNGVFIPEDRLAAYVAQYADNDCTEFEFLTAVMYRYFADEAVDYAVVECGMGGKGDATNVERENLAVITAISLDHTDFFGSSLLDIAEEKAGILRPNSPCVLFPDNRIKPVFSGKCSSLITPRLPNNLSLVNCVLSQLHLPPVTSLVKLPARQEKIGRILLDGGHNTAAADHLAPLLHKEVAVIGMMKDKDVEGYLARVASRCKTVIATQPSHPRALDAATLADIAEDYCDNVLVVDAPADAVRHPSLSLVCGSFYLAREVRNILLSR
ncbi:MAG: hypothetical protein IJ168_05545 [Eubacterium sp.]|nr:hypothetical protein [Eubacterium sp.]